MPPQNLEAEQSVLGSVLLDNETFAQIEGMLRAEHFYKEGHRKVFRAMERLFRRGEPMDLVTLTEELRQRGELEEIGSVPYLIGLADTVPTAAYAEHYARIVVEKSILRELIARSGTIMQTAYDQAMPIEQVLDKAEAAIFDMSTFRRRQDFQGMGDLVQDTFAYINELFANPDPVSGLRTGFKELDGLTAGLQPSSLNVLAARPSMGKCLTKGMLITLPNTGERITIEEFVRRRERCVHGVAEDGSVRPSGVSDWVDSGVKPCFRVVTRSGRRVEVTGHHPFLTGKGWTPLSEIGRGDLIAVPRLLPCFGRDSDLPLGKVRLIAYFLSEGGSGGDPLRFTNSDRVISQDFMELIAEHFPEDSCSQAGTAGRVGPERAPSRQSENSGTLAGWLSELGVPAGSPSDKSFPEDAWRFDEPRLRELLRTLFSCDASVCSATESQRSRIELPLASERLARDVHHALVRYGIVARLWRGADLTWRVEIAEPESLVIYGQRIGWIGERAALSSPRQAEPEDTSAGEAAGWTFPLQAERPGEARLPATVHPLTNPDLHWDEIVAVEPIGDHQVYDLTVPDGANFIAEDICVHNTSLALSIAQNVALREGKPVGVFSLEMSALQLVTRMLCSEARVDMSRVRNGQLSDRDFQRLADTAGKMSEAKIFIDDNADMTVMELRSRARRLVSDHGSALIVIDYLQLMSGGNSENRQQEISNISRGLKALARELDVPVLVLSQLSRAVESRPNKRPMLSDLRESGAIEQDADLVMFIYRDEYYDQQSEKQGIAEVIIGKQRNGPVGTVELQFHNAHVRFNDLARTAG